MEKMSITAGSSVRRVKFYRLSGGLKQGAVHLHNIIVEYSEESRSVGLYLVDDQDSERQLLHNIIPFRKKDRSCREYRITEGEAIVWREPLIAAQKVALIFEDKKSRDFIWKSICRWQRIVNFDDAVTTMLSDLGDDIHLFMFSEISELSSVIKIFYERGLGQLIDVITSDSHVSPEILLRICELLHFCILDHTKKTVKANFLVNNVIEKVLVLTGRREKYVVAAAIRFLKALVSLKDDQVEDHIVKNDLFRPVVAAFVENGRRYNLLNSCVLELIEFIRKENRQTLIKYAVQSGYLASMFEASKAPQRSDERAPGKDSITGPKLETCSSNSCRSLISDGKLVDDDWKHPSKKRRIF